MSESFSFDDLKFWLQVLKDGERTIICNPEWESRVKTMVDAHWLGGQITVRADPCAPEDQLFVIDENAIEASMRESFQRDAHERMAAWRRRLMRDWAYIPPAVNPRGFWRITGC